jgi:hypothetical protein
MRTRGGLRGLSRTLITAAAAATFIGTLFLMTSAAVSAQEKEEEIRALPEDVKSLLQALPHGYYAALTAARPGLKFESRYFSDLMSLNEYLAGDLEQIEESASRLGIELSAYHLHISLSANVDRRNLEYIVGPFTAEQFFEACKSEYGMGEPQEKEVAGKKVWVSADGSACTMFAGGGLFGPEEVVAKILDPGEEAMPVATDSEEFMATLELVDFDSQEFGSRFDDKDLVAMSFQRFAQSVEAGEEVVEAGKSLTAIGYSNYWSENFETRFSLLFSNEEAAEKVEVYLRENTLDLLQKVGADVLSGSLPGQELVTRDLTPLQDNVAVTRVGNIVTIKIQVDIEDLKEFILTYDCSAASRITVGKEEIGELQGGLPVIFSFDVEQEGYYRIAAGGEHDTVGILLDGECEKITEEEYGGEGDNFVINQKLEPGTYYIAVRCYDDEETGAFTLTVDEVKPFGGEGLADAKALLVGGSEKGVLIGSTRRFFRFEIGEPGLYSVSTSGEMDTYGELLDVFGQKLESNDDDEEDLNFAIERKLNPGTYYLAVSGIDESESGDTTLQINKTVPKAQKCENAGSLTAGIETSVILNPSEINIWKFEVQEAGLCRIFAREEIEAQAALYDSFCQAFETGEEAAEQGSWPLERKLVPGTYYLEVAGLSVEEPITVTLVLEISPLPEGDEESETANERN